ncbi:hypothetical protein BC829DRAFT_13859 [Chytridium lagenaria]|nr:hypothetical protein BC829DRAFT_13859 [Chytridium lagenaria]
MSNLNEPYTINSPESDDENNSHSGSPALQEPSEPSANPSPRPSHNIFSTITNILEDETRRTVSHLSAGLKEVRKTRKAREADFKAMEQEVSKLRVEAARKMGKREEEESIEQEIRGIEESTEAKRRMIQELESQLLECQREDMNLWAWKRRLATIAMQQQAAIDKAAPRIAEAENQQVDLFRKAKELEEEQRGYYDGLNTSIEQIMELHTQMMALATDVNSVDVEKGVTVEQLEEATRMVVRAGTERLKRWAHRQNIRATVETTKEVFQTLEEDAKLAILNFEALIEKEEDSYLDHRKDFADEQTRRYNGLVRFSTEKWETFDWSRCYEQEYEILEVTLAKPYAEVDLGTFFIDDIVTMN